MTDQTQASAETAQPEQAAEAQPSADLNVNDLVAVRNIIDVASQRGAFKAAELEMVGKVYNKLNTFLESVGKKQEA
jgi:hypothetical protein